MPETTAPDAPDFRPACPGQTLVYVFADGVTDRYPLQGWVLTDDGWLPAFWEDNALRWIELSDAEDLTEIRLETAPTIDRAALADHATALREHADTVDQHASALHGHGDALDRHNSAMSDHADTLSRHGHGHGH